MKKIKVGIFGARRGMNYARHFIMLNCEVVAVCENRPEIRENVEKTLKELGSDAVYYEDFDAFIEHDMDAVFVANNFHEHVPFVVRLMEKGIHVLSECISNGTMAEGVELIRAAEKSDAIYMLAENYPMMLFNREMQRVCKGGTLGKILFAEGEYNHPVSPYDENFYKMHTYSLKHWRNYLPATYYITHSMGPVMCATGATPKRVTAMPVYAPADENIPSAKQNADRAAIITTLNDDDSVFRVVGCAGFGAHHNSYRFCGTKGQIENVRGMGNKVMLRYDAWNVPEGMEENNLYEPNFDDEDDELIKASGHGGGDYLTAKIFVECIREGKQPPHPFHVHAAVAMSSVAILGHRSLMEGGVPYDIPDFHCEEARKQYENDRLSPFFGMDGSEPTLPCCSHPDYKPSEEQLQKYLELIK